MLAWLRGMSRSDAGTAVIDTNDTAAPWASDADTIGAAACAGVVDECARTCPLDACSRGGGALVVRVDCATPDACRLRALGVYEGARVNVVDSRNGLLLEVRGSRIALGAAVAASIAVVPLP